MLYRNLHHLIQNSQSSRRYFLSLPVTDQCMLHEFGQWIHTAADLHRMRQQLQAYNRLSALGGWRK